MPFFRKNYSVKKLQNWEQRSLRYKLFIDMWREERLEHVKLIKHHAVAMYQWRKNTGFTKFFWLSEIQSPRTPSKRLAYSDALSRTAYLGILCTSGCSSSVLEYEIKGDEIIFFVLYEKEKNDSNETGYVSYTREKKESSGTRLSEIKEFEDHGVENVYKILDNGDLKFLYAINHHTGKKTMTFHGKNPIFTKRL